MWEFFAPAGGAGVVFEVDCATKGVVGIRAFTGSQEVATDHEDQAKLDWETYSGM